MKSITSAEEIHFNYDSSNKLIFGEESVVVNDEIAKVALERLGDQITVTPIDAPDEDAGNSSKDEGSDGPSFADLKARAKELGLKQNGTKDELAARIAEKEAADKEDAELAAQGKKKATQEDLDASPDLVEAGVKVGDVIDTPAAE